MSKYKERNAWRESNEQIRRADALKRARKIARLDAGESPDRVLPRYRKLRKEQDDTVLFSLTVWQALILFGLLALLVKVLSAREQGHGDRVGIVGHECPHEDDVPVILGPSGTVGLPSGASPAGRPASH